MFGFMGEYSHGPHTFYITCRQNKYNKETNEDLSPTTLSKLNKPWSFNSCFKQSFVCFIFKRKKALSFVIIRTVFHFINQYNISNFMEDTKINKLNKYLSSYSCTEIV